jgi:hypothetical protein
MATFDAKAYHRGNLVKIGQAIMVNRDFEKPEFQVQIPREAARLEQLSYGEAETKLLQAHDNYVRVTTYLAQAESAEAFLKRYVAMKEKTMIAELADTDADGKKVSFAQKEATVAADPAFGEQMGLLRSAEEITAYLRRIAEQTKEALQVIKKVRDASFERSKPRA